MESERAFEILATFRGLFLLGLLADLVGRRSFLPRVTLLVLCGVVVGPAGLDALPVFTADGFSLLTIVALTMIGFLLGETLTHRSVRELGPSVLAISASVVVATTGLVDAALALLGLPVGLALLLGGIATATAPAATVDTVRELSAEGRFTDTLLGIVAADDTWGVVVFSLLLAGLQGVTGRDAAGGVALSGARQLGGALALGALVGLPMALLAGRVRPGEPTQTEAPASSCSAPRSRFAPTSRI